MTNRYDTATIANYSNDILRSINSDLINRPNFTMTHDQLRARINEYLEYRDEALAGLIYSLLTCCIRCFRD